MLLLLLLLGLLTAAFLLLNTYTAKRSGISNALFYFKCKDNSWIAETAWLNPVSGEVCKIITTCHWQDGITSVLSDGEIVYHTKQPSNTRPALLRYHRIARNR